MILDKLSFLDSLFVGFNVDRFCWFFFESIVVLLLDWKFFVDLDLKLFVGVKFDTFDVLKDDVLKDEDPLKLDLAVDELFCWLSLFLKTIWIVFLLPWFLLDPEGPKFFLICNLPLVDSLRGFF